MAESDSDATVQEAPAHSCSECGKVFQTTAALQGHSRVHKRSRSARGKCNVAQRRKQGRHHVGVGCVQVSAKLGGIHRTKGSTAASSRKRQYALQRKVKNLSANVAQQKQKRIKLVETVIAHTTTTLTLGTKTAHHQTHCRQTQTRKHIRRK